MESRVKVSDLVGEMHIQPDEVPIYFDKSKGEFLHINERFFRAIEFGKTKEDFSQDWEKETFEQAKDVRNSDQYVRIPTNRDIHEWDIMKDFCYTIDDEDVKDDLLNAIHGRGAFRMFKDKIRHYGIREDWFDFRDKEFTKIAKQWCEKQDIEYIEE